MPKGKKAVLDSNTIVWRTPPSLIEMERLRSLMTQFLDLLASDDKLRNKWARFPEVMPSNIGPWDIIDNPGDPDDPGVYVDFEFRLEDERVTTEDSVSSERFFYVRRRTAREVKSIRKDLTDAGVGGVIGVPEKPKADKPKKDKKAKKGIKADDITNVPEAPESAAYDGESGAGVD